uniref:Transcriptional regulator, HxlR family n=1 Tax=Caulobacter sp. (strain K31) TaxID=366602 RepID=B0T971_CAUSK
MKRKSLEDASCPVARSLDVIGDWWSLLIVRDALYGTRRFSEFKRSLGLATNTLAARLKAMVSQGILEVAPASDGSAYQEYVLTPKGEALLPVVIALSQWGGDHLYAPGEEQAAPLDAEHRQPVQRLEVVSQDGRRLAPRDLVVGEIRSASAA